MPYNWVSMQATDTAPHHILLHLGCHLLQKDPLGLCLKSTLTEDFLIPKRIFNTRLFLPILCRVCKVSLKKKYIYIYIYLYIYIYIKGRVAVGECHFSNAHKDPWLSGRAWQLFSLCWVQTKRVCGSAVVLLSTESSCGGCQSSYGSCQSLYGTFSMNAMHGVHVATCR